MVELNQVLGKHITEALVNEDWHGRWPEIDRRGYITGLYDGDAIPDDAVLVDWSSTNKRGHITIVDGNNGFEAILSPADL